MPSAASRRAAVIAGRVWEVLGKACRRPSKTQGKMEKMTPLMDWRKVRMLKRVTLVSRQCCLLPWQRWLWATRPLIAPAHLRP